MTKRTDREEQRLGEGDAGELLRRAAELDAATGARATVAELRRAAIEAGISPAAFDVALATSGRSDLKEISLDESGRSYRGQVPRWVRVCLFGVPDRRSAMTFYWLFIAAMGALPLLTFTGVQGSIGAAGIALFLLFASWSTSRAVKWADKHGWSLLR